MFGSPHPRRLPAQAHLEHPREVAHLLLGRRSALRLDLPRCAELPVQSCPRGFCNLECPISPVDHASHFQDYVRSPCAFTSLIQRRRTVLSRSRRYTDAALPGFSIRECARRTSATQRRAQGEAAPTRDQTGLSTGPFGKT